MGLNRKRGRLNAELFARTRDDCGFSPFSIDEKPNHGSPDYARDIAFQKITNRVKGTRMAAEKLNLGLVSAHA